MPFPDRPRVVYDNNPITEVICQLRFPAILRVDQGDPVEFQDQIREHYPIYKEEEPVGSIALPEPFKQLLAGVALQAQGARAARRFISDDSQLMISLARDFLAVSCESYTRWEDFKIHLNRAIETLERIYGPSFYSRVGLRYHNRIRRPDLSLSDAPWSELLAPHIAAALADAKVGPLVQESKHIILIDLAIGKVRVRHGLEAGDDGEQVYVIDNDFFRDDRTELPDVEGTVNYFNEQARNIFRWCITPRLHDAMAPELVERAAG